MANIDAQKLAFLCKANVQLGDTCTAEDWLATIPNTAAACRRVWDWAEDVSGMPFPDDALWLHSSVKR